MHNLIERWSRHEWLWIGLSDPGIGNRYAIWSCGKVLLATIATWSFEQSCEFKGIIRLNCSKQVDLILFRTNSEIYLAKTKSYSVVLELSPSLFFPIQTLKASWPSDSTLTTYPILPIVRLYSWVLLAYWWYLTLLSLNNFVQGLHAETKH